MPNEFTTIDRLKTFLGITTTADDTLLTRLIAVATASIQAMTGRKLVYTTYTQKCYYKDDYLDVLLLDEFPAESITSIVDSNGNTISADDYCLHSEDGMVYVEWLADLSFLWWGDCEYLTVTYLAGYETIPADLEQACIEYVKQMYSDRDLNSNLSAEKLGDYSYSRISTAGSSSSSIVFNSTISKYGKIENNYVG